MSLESNLTLLIIQLSGMLFLYYSVQNSREEKRVMEWIRLNGAERSPPLTASRVVALIHLSEWRVSGHLIAFHCFFHYCQLPLH